MSTRIRYRSTRPDTNTQFVSIKSFVGGEGEYLVHLDMLNMAYDITDVTGTLATSGTAKSANALKGAAKKALVGLGVVFTKEARKEEANTVAA